MLKVLAGWRLRKRLIEMEAVVLVGRYRSGAYEDVRTARRLALQRGDWREVRRLTAVGKEVAKRIGKEVGLDTATRYVECVR